MMPNPTSRRQVDQPAVFDPSAFASGVESEESPATERLKALLRELDEGHNRWADQIIAMIEEDSRQLLKDFGLR